MSSAEQVLTVTLRGQHLQFYTDRGVFSKRGIDFGSQLLLETIQVGMSAKILDVGCGYGPLGLTLAKESPARRITMVDINERAVSLAKKNAQLNQLQQVLIMESDLFNQVTEQNFDCILSNPPIRAGKKIVYTLFEQGYDYLADKGELWIVIQKKQGADSALRKLETLFSVVEEKNKKKGYSIFCAKK